MRRPCWFCEEVSGPFEDANGLHSRTSLTGMLVPIQLGKDRSYAPGAKQLRSSREGLVFLALNVELQQVNAIDPTISTKTIERDRRNTLAAALDSDEVHPFVGAGFPSKALERRLAGLAEYGELVDMQSVELVERLGLSEVTRDFGSGLEGVNRRVVPDGKRGQAVDPGVRANVEYHARTSCFVFPDIEEIRLHQVRAEEIELPLEHLPDIASHLEAAMRQSCQSLRVAIA